MLALALASIGLYGVASYSRYASERAKSACGWPSARARGSVLRLILGHGMLLVGAGVAIGLVAAFGTVVAHSRGVSPERQRPRSADVCAARLLLLTVVALVATCIPAYRATRIDPLVALRAE